MPELERINLQVSTGGAGKETHELSVRMFSMYRVYDGKLRGDVGLGAYLE